MSYVDELIRGYGEPAKKPANRVNLDPWLSDDHKARIDLYAERNVELHILAHDMLGALEAARVEPAIIHAFRQRLHNVPQCRGV